MQTNRHIFFLWIFEIILKHMHH